MGHKVWQIYGPNWSVFLFINAKFFFIFLIMKIQLDITLYIL